MNKKIIIDLIIKFKQLDATEFSLDLIKELIPHRLSDEKFKKKAVALVKNSFKQFIEKLYSASGVTEEEVNQEISRQKYGDSHKELKEYDFSQIAEDMSKYVKYTLMTLEEAKNMGAISSPMMVESLLLESDMDIYTFYFSEIPNLAVEDYFQIGERKLSTILEDFFKENIEKLKGDKQKNIKNYIIDRLNKFVEYIEEELNNLGIEDEYEPKKIYEIVLKFKNSQDIRKRLPDEEITPSDSLDLFYKLIDAFTYKIKQPDMDVAPAAAAPEVKPVVAQPPQKQNLFYTPLDDEFFQEFSNIINVPELEIKDITYNTIDHIRYVLIQNTKISRSAVKQDNLKKLVDFIHDHLKNLKNILLDDNLEKSEKEQKILQISIFSNYTNLFDASGVTAGFTTEIRNFFEYFKEKARESLKDKKIEPEKVEPKQISSKDDAPSVTTASGQTIKLDISPIDQASTEEELPFSSQSEKKGLFDTINSNADDSEDEKNVYVIVAEFADGDKIVASRKLSKNNLKDKTEDIFQKIVDFLNKEKNNFYFNEELAKKYGIERFFNFSSGKEHINISLFPNSKTYKSSQNTTKEMAIFRVVNNKIYTLYKKNIQPISDEERKKSVEDILKQVRPRTLQNQTDWYMQSENLDDWQILEASLFFKQLNKKVDIKPEEFLRFINKKYASVNTPTGLQQVKNKLLLKPTLFLTSEKQKERDKLDSEIEELKQQILIIKNNAESNDIVLSVEEKKKIKSLEKTIKDIKDFRNKNYPKRQGLTSSAYKFVQENNLNSEEIDPAAISSLLASIRAKASPNTRTGRRKKLSEFIKSNKLFIVIKNKLPIKENKIKVKIYLNK